MNTKWVWVASLAGLAGIICLIVWLATPRKVGARVESVEWRHLAHLRERVVRHDGDWGRPSSSQGFYNEPPFNVSCYSKFYGMEQCNPRPCSSNQKDGTCYDSCPEYRRWCDYDFYDWPVLSTQEAFGTGHDTFWPETPKLEVNQRIQRVGKYMVRFRSFGKEALSYEPDSLLEYKRYVVGEAWHLKVSKVTSNTRPVSLMTAEAN